MLSIFGTQKKRICVCYSRYAKVTYSFLDNAFRHVNALDLISIYRCNNLSKVFFLLIFSSISINFQISWKSEPATTTWQMLSIPSYIIILYLHIWRGTANFIRFVFTPSYQREIMFKMIFSDIPADLVSINKDRAVKALHRPLAILGESDRA